MSFWSSKQQTQDLEASKKKLEALDNLVRSLNRSVATIRFSPNGEVQEANSLFLNTLGYTLEEVVGQHHRIFCVGKYTESPEYRQFWDRLRAGEAQVGTFERKRKDGSTLWLEATYFPVMDAENKVVGVFKVAQDVTRKQLEWTSLRAISDALNLSMAVIEFELDGTIITANQNFLDAMGYSLADIAGKHHRMFCTDEFYQKHPDFWAHLGSGRFESGLFERRDARGNPVWLEASYNPIKDSNGKVLKVIKFGSNVTRQMEEKLAVSKASEMSVSTAEETAQIAVEGGNLLNESVSMSNTILDEVASTSELLQKLNEQSTSIEAIVSTIRSIADQTNLLALNAAIEAARAGDQGRGFAVVADEVRQLANRTSQSTLEIETVVNENKQLSKSATDRMSKVSENVKVSNEQIAQANRVMTEIQQGAENVSRTASALLNNAG